MPAQGLVFLPYAPLVPLTLNPNLPNSIRFNPVEATEGYGLTTDDALGNLHEGGIVAGVVHVTIADVDLGEEDVQVWVQGADVDFVPAACFGAGEPVGHEIFEV